MIGNIDIEYEGYISLYFSDESIAISKVSATAGGGKYVLGLDTQANGSVTPLPRLAGVLDQTQRFLIHGWNAKSDNQYSYAGHNHFLGSVVLNAAAEYTLLSYYYMLDLWYAEWAQDGSSVKLSFKDDKNLSLNFAFIPGVPQKRVLICIIDDVMLDKLCSVNINVNNIKTESELS